MSGSGIARIDDRDRAVARVFRPDGSSALLVGFRVEAGGKPNRGGYEIRGEAELVFLAEEDVSDGALFQISERQRSPTEPPVTHLLRIGTAAGSQ